MVWFVALEFRLVKYVSSRDCTLLRELHHSVIVFERYVNLEIDSIELY